MNIEEQLHFDGREMLMVHDVFRREFALMPALVRGVAVGDHNRAQIVRSHRACECPPAPSPPGRTPVHLALLLVSLADHPYWPQRLDSVVR
jgi:hypothetical protein